MEDFPACGFVDVCGRMLESGRATGANGDAGAFTREFFRDGAAKPFAGSRDNSNSPS
jgi:hypothetical protein